MDAREQFSELFRQHKVAVLRYALRRTDEQLAADAVSEVFLVAWRRWEELPSDPLPWLIQTARRVIANQRRSRDRLDALHLRLRTEPAEPHADLAEQVGLFQVWSVAVRSLSPEDQEVIALIAWDGLSARQAAASLGCSVPAFVMRLHRARRRLTEQLDWAGEPGNRRPAPAAGHSERTAL